ncbi:flagellar hook-basal body complex protein [Jannaschia aquimarina]|uniref:FlgG_2 protein n=1 Tax=Jannaschia aquimarina TaxID=935700 RepID=A0A0D1E9I3_9RHOB|nr:flagellar hook-basal body complex protein [Jannaschia aquimarina]KIT14299.1 Flagellar basal-body rod protein FlgG [Jannaschia aquimarina]SNS50343.1 flagellar basal-body rod protein FlgF [Jannaschia aquimarina]
MDGILPVLSRQSGLMREMDIIAQNIANASTTGYRAEATIFAEHIRSGDDLDAPSMSMGHAHARFTDLSQGALQQTGGAYDFAIEGEGFFQVAGEDGPLLTRAGAFVSDPVGTLVTPDGQPVLDIGGAPIQVPPGAGEVSAAPDGTLSRGGEPFAQLGLVVPDDPNGLTRTSATRFRHDGALLPVDDGRVLQGFLEQSNTAPVAEIARMIEVQNAYGLGQSLLDREDERLRSMLRLMDPK